MDTILYTNNITSLKQENITHKYLILNKVLQPAANRSQLNSKIICYETIDYIIIIVTIAQKFY